MLLERITHINIIAEDAEKLENIIREKCWNILLEGTLENIIREEYYTCTVYKVYNSSLWTEGNAEEHYPIGEEYRNESIEHIIREDRNTGTYN